MRVLAAACLMAVTQSASAQNANDKAAAEALFDQGKAFMAAENYAAACPKFSESLRLDQGVGTSLWLAECYERSGKLASAWAQFREAAATAVKAGDPREKIAREHATLLEPKLPKLVIAVSKGPAGPEVKVTRDGEEVGPALWGTPVPIDSGAQGKKPFTATAHVPASAGTQTVSIPELEDDPYAPVPPPPPVATPGVGQTGTASPRAEPMSTLRIVALSVAAAGVAGLILGTAFGIDALTQLNASDGPCSPPAPGKNFSACTTQAGLNERNAALTAAPASTVAFVVGGALIVGGGVLYFLAPRLTHKSAESSATLVPVVTPGGGGLTVVGAF
jgi:serine/threonine-protein kinase